MYKLSEKAGDLDQRIRSILSECRDVVCSYDPEAALVLYGSRARGRPRADSDLDLLVLLREAMSSEKKNRIHDSLYEIGLAHDIVISTIIKTRTDWEQPITQATALYQSIQQEGILVA